ncbi:helix-turn-helix domain-containing protein [Nonomuraea polychroma]|uniref:helix-turn-helix domain-containing protein n=1 Tax=Nonomuraea polychroma TaxID=46176 RepID=UPI003D8F3AE4
MSEEAPGDATPVDDAPAPAWAAAYLSPGQLGIDRGLQWILLVYSRRGWDPSRVNVAQRLYVHTVGRQRKHCNPSIASLAEDCGISETTAAAAVEDLEAEGWLVVVRRRRHPNVYRLAWPGDDRHPGDRQQVPRCGAPTKKGGVCTRRAGRGTTTPGVGPCVLHGGTPAGPRVLSGPVEDSVEPQPLGSNEAVGPVDNPPTEQSSTPTAGEFDPNHWSVEPQPLERWTPTIGVEYVVSTSTSTKGVHESRVLAVGDLEDRNARATPAPPAQPRRSSRLRAHTPAGILARIPRYRPLLGTRYGWALIALLKRALAAGYSPEAITRYAEMVIGEACFQEHQHVPELRYALARLRRDADLGHTCRTCAQDPAICTCAWTHDQDITLDAAALERALAALGADPHERAACLAAARSAA